MKDTPNEAKASSSDAVSFVVGKNSLEMVTANVP
ncbi:hypothetical protein BJQ90_00594 [Arthrobacter sp. SO3]|nr:hypothetical protein [Arthrobacter sp. SO3]